MESILTAATTAVSALLISLFVCDEESNGVSFVCDDVPVFFVDRCVWNPRVAKPSLVGLSEGFEAKHASKRLAVFGSSQNIRRTCECMDIHASFQLSMDRYAEP